MPSLNYFLDRTQELCQKIQSLQFKAPGIFTNSFIAEPSITTLLKDAEPHELALYRIKKPLSVNQWSEKSSSTVNGSSVADRRLDYKVERADGKSYYVDQSFNEFINETDGDEELRMRKRTAVSIPEINGSGDHRADTSVSSSSSSGSNSKRQRVGSGPSSPIKLINLLDSSSQSIDEICKEAITLVKKYPDMVNEPDAEATIVGYREKYLSLQNEISNLEDIVEKQSMQLSDYAAANDSLLLSSPLRSAPRRVPRQITKEVDIDEALEQEEMEIRELESTLEQFSKEP